MSSDAARERQVFFEVHSGLPREGPGNRASTARALSLVGGRLPAAGIRVLLDVACGPGQQTVDLAALLPDARIVATDLHGPYLQEARRRLHAAGAGDRVSVVRADMRRLPLAPASVDLVWCEGAAYLMGIAEALAAWRGLLRPGGCAAFTDAVWLRDDPPDPVRACWAEYPSMSDSAAVVAMIERAGFEALPSFLLPAEAWWDDYYVPMSARIDQVARRHAGDPVARRALDACREEIEVCRRYGDCYGYAFFVACKPSG